MESSSLFALSPRLPLSASKTSSEQLAFETMLSPSREPATTTLSSEGELYYRLSVDVEAILNRLNELLSEKLPEGIESLDPAEYTPEKTAERIVSGATAFFDIFQRQNQELSSEELVDAFMGTIYRGIDSGFTQALSELRDIGALDVTGIEAGIGETRKLVSSKLEQFEKELRSSLKENEIVQNTKEEDLEQVGGKALKLVA